MGFKVPDGRKPKDIVLLNEIEGELPSASDIANTDDI